MISGAYEQSVLFGNNNYNGQVYNEHINWWAFKQQDDDQNSAWQMD